MQELGRLEDLPQDYRDELARNNLVPLWPSLRNVMPPHTPRPRTQPIAWPYQAIRPLLMQAGELTPIERPSAACWCWPTPAMGWRRCRPAPPSTWACSCCCPASGRPRTATRPMPCAWWWKARAPGAWSTARNAPWSAAT